MATVIDTLVTEYRMNSKQYEEGARKVVGSTQSVTAAITRATGGIGGLVASAGAALTGVAGGISIGFGVKAAMEFDTIQRSLVAITGSAERAKQVLSFTDKLAGPSIFSSQELASGAKLLEALGLQTEKYLPIAEKLGTIFGGNEEALMSYVTALGYLKSGRTGEAFESLGRAGISRELLQGKGLEFDKGGQYLGSARQALDAVESLVNEKFGKLSKEMADGPEAKWASVMDALTRGARTAGFVVLSLLVPAMEKVSNFIGYLVDSGRVKKAFQGIADLFGQGDIGSVLIKGLSIVLATLDNIPGIVKVIRNEFQNVGDVIAKVVSILAAVFLTGRIIAAINAITYSFTLLTTSIAAGASAATLLNLVLGTTDKKKLAAQVAVAAAIGIGTYEAMQALLGNLPDPGAMPGIGKVLKDAENIQKGFKAQSQGGVGTQILDAAIAAVEGQQAQKKANESNLPSQDPQEIVARNTTKLVDLQEKQLDFQTALIGGGQVGQQAFSGLEVAKATGGMSPVHRAAMKFADELSDIMGKNQIRVGRTYGYNR
jgi:hypothetical protein